jgi:PhnB protein
MITVNPYLVFKGNCEEAFTFYKSVFGVEFQFLGRYKDVPGSDRQTFATEEDDKIMHVSLPLSSETTLMGCDSTEAFGQSIMPGNNFSLFLNTESCEEADRLFNELSAGGLIKMPMNQTFWGAYFGMLTDRFSIDWMIAYELKSVLPEEILNKKK